MFALTRCGRDNHITLRRYQFTTRQTIELCIGRCVQLDAFDSLYFGKSPKEVIGQSYPVIGRFISIRVAVVQFGIFFGIIKRTGIVNTRSIAHGPVIVVIIPGKT